MYYSEMAITFSAHNCSLLCTYEYQYEATSKLEESTPQSPSFGVEYLPG